MNRSHPPKYPPHRNEDDYTIADVIAGIIVVACMYGIVWVMFALDAAR